MNHQEIAKQIAEYNGMNLHRKIGNSKGFFKFYFEELKKHNTKIEAFNYVNELHMDLFGEYRYAEWSTFRRAVNNYNKQS